MTCEVLVVGAGIGGLTVAALAAARGMSVCVVEKESRGGGCVAAFEKFGYRFEPTAGLYSGWGEDEIHARVFAELPVAPPAAHQLSPAYTVRLPDAAQVRAGAETAVEFENELRAAFPECAITAINFYRDLHALADARAELARRATTRPGLFQRLKGGGDAQRAARLVAARSETVAPHLAGASPRFRRFIDSQLQLFASCASDECSYLDATDALDAARRGLYALEGGAAALADTLTESIRLSGGSLRFDTTALRLAYDAAGAVSGVELMSGETLRASRAYVSNLTAWDTYGKLVGASRTPAAVRARLKSLRGWGAYLIFLSLEEDAAARLPSTRMLLLDDSEVGADSEPPRAEFDPARDLFTLNVAPAWDVRAPAGRRAATLCAFADAGEWFTYHEDESEHEAQDRHALEFWWERLHRALPELGAGAEVIETLTPRGYYEQTRRRLGAVWGAARTVEVAAGADDDAASYRTHLPNLYLVGDTAAGANTVAAVTRAARAVANEIAPPR
ncbi:MAG: phytoene desaturase family protein [Pyrinomonadaceae bacterium]